MHFFLESKKGELYCGDRYIVQKRNEGIFYAVIDAIGHGEKASCIADIAYTSMQKTLDKVLIEITVQKTRDKTLIDIIETCQSELAKTRGVVIFFVLFLPKLNRLYYFGVGNINCLLITPSEVIKLRSTPGIFGNHALPISLTQIKVPKQTKLLMFTDGIEEIKTQNHPQLQLMNSRHIISFLSQKWSGKDDICCICESLNG